jgi:hypothetical protein
MEAGLVFGGEFDGETSTLVTSLLTADLGMVGNLWVITIETLRLSHVAIDDIRIFAVGHDGQGGCGKDMFQSLTTIYKHVARGGTHEKFDTRDAMRIELWEKVCIIIGGAKEKTVVHMALPGSQSKLILQSLKGRGLRHGIGHVKVGCDTTSGSGTALCVDIGLFRQTWLPEMHMVIDDTGEHETARSIDDLVIRYFGRIFNNLYYLFVLNDE